MTTVSACLVDMPNLIELMEAGGAPSRCDFSIASDELQMRLEDASMCADEPGQPPSLLAQSSLSAAALCADDGNDFKLEPVAATGLSICADDGGDGPSDVRLKADIEQVGTTVYGLPLFQFRYTNGVERFEGVMAQDVLNVMPEAVSVGADGFYRVNYRKLGIAMTRA